MWDVASTTVNQRKQLMSFDRIALPHLLFVPLLASACAASSPYIWVGDLAAQTAPRRIEIGDRIYVQVKDQASLSGEFAVRANGAYLQPIVGELDVVNMLPDDAAKMIAGKLTGIVVTPLVSVSISAPRSLRVTVIGEVRTPGTFELPTPDGVLGMLARAGGLTEFASHNGIYVLRTNPKRQRIRFRYSELTSGDPDSTQFKLRDGDVVVVE